MDPEPGVSEADPDRLRSDTDEAASDDAQLPLRVERERLSDGRAISYYSRPAAAEPAEGGAGPGDGVRP